jgi:hypothetical protein
VGSTRPQRASRAQGVLEWGGGIRQQGDVLSNVENGDQQHAAAVQHPVLRPPMLRRGARERKYADRPRAPLARRRGLVGLGGRPGPLRRSLRKRLRRGRRARLARAARGGRAKLSPTNKKGEIRDLQRRATRTNTEGSSNTLPCTLLVVSVAGSACGHQGNCLRGGLTRGWGNTPAKGAAATKKKKSEKRDILAFLISHCGMPAITRAQAASQCVSLASLDEDSLREVLYRAPAYTHDILAVVCKTFRRVMKSEEPNFAINREALGHTEPLVLAFGGQDCFGYGHHHTCLLALVEGEWVFRADMPVWGPHIYHILHGEYLFLFGGGRLPRDEDHVDGPLQCHGYDIVADEWRSPPQLENDPGNRIGAAIARVGDDSVPVTIIIAGGEIEDWGDDDPHQLTASVKALTLTLHQHPTPTRWEDLPPMLHAVGDCCGFVLAECLHIIGLERQASIDSRCMQVLDLKTNEWSMGTSPPVEMKLGRSRHITGTVHSGRFFCLSNPINEGEAPVVYAYLPDEERWMMQASLPAQDPSSSGKFEWGKSGFNRGLTVTSCAAGIIVLDRSGGQTVLLRVVDGAINSVGILYNEDFDERVSAFAQDYGLQGLEVASCELSSHYQALFKDWAEQLEEKQCDEETYERDRREDEDGNEDEDDPKDTEFIENISAARSWLQNAGCPLIHERREIR